MNLRLSDRDMDSVTALDWSPTENILAAGDYSGGYYRWRNTIPDSHPPPIKSKTSSTTRSAQHRDTLGLFDDDTPRQESPTRGAALNQNGDIGDDLVDLDPIDWIEDDLGSEPDKTVEKQNKYVKEMGLF
jgi:hypothetical protein